MKLIIKIFLLLFLTTSVYAQSTCGGELNLYRWGTPEAMTLCGSFPPSAGSTAPFDSCVTTPQIAAYYADRSFRGVRCGLKVNLNHLNGVTHSSLTFRAPTESFSTDMLITKLTESTVKFSLLILEAAGDMFALDVVCLPGSTVCALHYSELDGIRKDTSIRFDTNDIFKLTVRFIKTGLSDYTVIINTMTDSGPAEVVIPLHTSTPYTEMPFSSIHIGKPNEAGTISGDATLDFLTIDVQ